MIRRRICFYIKDNISFKTRNDLRKNIVNMEVTFIELNGQPSPYQSDKLLS